MKKTGGARSETNANWRHSDVEKSCRDRGA
jgi:hypothetical protein